MRMAIEDDPAMYHDWGEHDESNAALPLKTTCSTWKVI